MDRSHQFPAKFKFQQSRVDKFPFDIRLNTECPAGAQIDDVLKLPSERKKTSLITFYVSKPYRQISNDSNLSTAGNSVMSLMGLWF